MTEIRYSMADRVTLESLNNHLRKHSDKIDPKIHNHHVVLFGENNDNGLCASTRELKDKMKNVENRLDKYDVNINKIVWMVGGTLITAVLNLIIKIPNL